MNVNSGAPDQYINSISFQKYFSLAQFRAFKFHSMGSSNYSYSSNFNSSSSRDLKLGGFSYFYLKVIVYSLSSKLGLTTDFKTNKVKYAHMTYMCSSKVYS